MAIATLLLLCRAVMPGDINQTPPRNAEHARSILKEGIESKQPDIRVQTIFAAGMIGRHERVLAPLERCLQDEDIQVRIAAVHALADLKLPESKPALEKTLNTDDVPEVAFAAAKALYALNDPAGQAALLDVYNERTNPNSNFLKKQTREFMRNFRSFGSATMFIVSEGIGYVPVPGVGEGFTAMTELLSDPDLSPRATVVLLLAKQKTPETLKLLKKALSDDDWSVRASAAQMIAHTARTEVRESLVPLFEDKKEKVRFRAAAAYLHLYLQEQDAPPKSF